jgi:hypothetical protein
MDACFCEAQQNRIAFFDKNSQSQIYDFFFGWQSYLVMKNVILLV